MPETLDTHVIYTRKEWETKYYIDCIEYIRLNSLCYNFIDVGGCVGEVTTIMKEKITSLRDFYVIEPVRQNFEYILQRFDKNIIVDSNQTFYKIELGSKVIHVFNKAIYYGSEEISLGQLSDYTNVGGWSFSERHNHSVMSSIKTMGLEEIPVPEIIKIDIEGLEINLLEHSELVRRCKFIFLELHDELKERAEWLLSKYLPDHRIVFSKEEQYFLELF